ncbi:MULTISPECIES: TIGR04076 family protein [unclassified Paenibacillus]|uniref:TIGR04076 family protein n=1 Tax=unclassified Paenibacillus TaxID=185978 RepID=UPI002406D036|nr:MULTISPECIES: TIGR04076 family protein [unclassified Paenibacillus]MDF9844145.1 putative repeat protein (TIGR04076 family) [Paenibacillus sp. PastF-2]MDF9850732.1 putative repeat protein (TIGR04076 family) [Paenibacillus sp. PastM-2]MDF9857303.1 putative repeat protein (TIGR04076 family) [Paenibacillus sp. PastF-1]MDH6482589.1 putative repeat protein (TIGR04076 family) [Paenibacillus sp. PastH-2]MDH6510016.1 putative repeat protein (TIGR04076 family) [Paenibacillus sp. PastM-3]
MKKLKIEVIEKRGPAGCENNYQVGQTWIMEDNCVPEGFCIGVLSALLPWFTCALYDASIPWSNDGSIEVCCTDPDHPVVFRINEYAGA